MRDLLVCWVWLFIIGNCDCQYAIPTVKVEPLAPKGLRVSIPHQDGVQIFQFHGRINKPLSNVEPGELTKEITQQTDSRWVYYDPNVELKIGDTIYYYIFVQHDRLGYRKDDQQFKVADISTGGDTSTSCDPSATVINGGISTCSGATIFEDDFSGGSIDSTKWIVENRFNTYTGPEYEFNSYQNSDDVQFIRSSALNLKPAVLNNDETRGKLDLTQSCTSQVQQECKHTASLYALVPPIKSAKVISKFTFKYGKIEIRAKFSKGDWIFSQMSLEPRHYDENSLKLLIAGANGNERLTAPNGTDIGSRLLYGGPVLAPEPPFRTAGLKSRQATNPYANEMHTYTLLWNPANITVYVDSEQYGSITTDQIQQLGQGNRFNPVDKLNSEMHISFGVVVGGVVQFPEDYLSGNFAKPWQNGDSRSLKVFYSKQNDWKTTWSDDNLALQIDYVKIWAI